MANFSTEAEAVANLTKPVVEQLERGQLIALQDGYTLADLEKYLPGRNRARGSFATPVFEDFKSYILAFQESSNAAAVSTDKDRLHAPVFVSNKEFEAVAYLNYLNADLPQGHCDHVAILALTQTSVWARIKSLIGSRLNQKSFAILLEDWVGTFNAVDESHQTIPYGEAIHAVRNMQVSESSKTECNVSNLTESRSLMERVEAQSTAGRVPAYFKIQDCCYLGLDEREITLRLSTSTADGSTQFSLQIVAADLLAESQMKEFKQKVIDLLPENPVRIGLFDKKQNSR